MEITDDIIIHLEKLGNIELDKEQKCQVKSDLQKVISYINTLDELNTDKVEPTSHSSVQSNVFNDDEVLNSDKRDEILSNAKNKHNGYFKVHKTVD